MTKRLLLPLFILCFIFLGATKHAGAVGSDGDINGDYVVDNEDYSIWLANFGKSVNTGKPAGDINNDAHVDGIDYVIWHNTYGQIIPTPTLSTAPSSAPASSSSVSEIWITKSEIAALPPSGVAWERMKSAAVGTWGTPNLMNQDNKHGISVLAAAFVYAKTGDSALRTRVRDGILAAKRTGDESSEWQTQNGVLSLGRQLGTYVIAAGLIELGQFDPLADAELRSWLNVIRTTNVGTHGRWKSIGYTCENSANNWGTFACPSRLAASLYLGDIADVDRTAQIIRAWMGERSVYPANAPGSSGYFQPSSGWLTSGSTWACDAANWKAVNPLCEKAGVNVDGALVEDVSRGGACCSVVGSGYDYSWEALQGVFVSAELLYRTGRYGNPYLWSDKALLRALNFMHRSNWQITNVATYVPWLANKRYGTSFVVSTSNSGRIMSWGDWQYQ